MLVKANGRISAAPSSIFYRLSSCIHTISYKQKWLSSKTATFGLNKNWVFNYNIVAKKTNCTTEDGYVDEMGTVICASIVGMY